VPNVLDGFIITVIPQARLMNGEFRIGPWLVQPSLNVISEDGTTVHLEPKVMEVLVCLAQCAGEPVPREELIRTVWPGTFVTDDVLKRCVSELRRVFEDDAREPRIIETIPKRGYRLLVPVDKVELTPSNHASATGRLNVVTPAEGGPQPAEFRKTRATKRLMQVTASTLVLIACATVAYLGGKRSTVLAPPSFHRLTFERGIIYSARFAPDNQVVYDASWDNEPIRTFTTRAGVPQPIPLDFASAHLLGISGTGELALTLNGYPMGYPVFLKGTLARAPMAGGAPRQLLEDVRWADWDRNGELAVVHHWNGRSRLEYPLGKVLHENAGWISHIRFSPRNDRIAFAEHPIWIEDRGSIVVVDLKGEVKILSAGWESAQGLAWSPSGDEIWFTAAKSGERRDLYAVDLQGRQRTLLHIPGGITLHDISLDGRVLLTVDNERSGTIALSPAGERDLSWSDIGFPVAISPDGKQVLLDDQSDRAGSDYWVGLRSIDGSPPVLLGEGWGGGFSPDGKWTATMIPSRPESTFLLPIGAGERRELKHPGIKTYASAIFFMPDGRSVVSSGIESGHSPRSYIQDLQGGPARPVTPEGVLGGWPSPNGSYLVAFQPDRTRVIYDIQRGESRAIPGTTGQLWPAGWSPDSRYLYIYTRSGPPSQIWRLDIGSGRRKLVRQLSPTDPAGILEIFNIQMTPDAKTFVYGYDRYLSELYIVGGLH
jgi:DNA-binding winged helix-turn-helix (wHTH) protein/Tol biopolymer transport system component